MIDIIVNGQPLDLNVAPSVLINRSIADIREPEARESDWTKTIEIPGTAQNNKIFSHLFEVEQTVYGTSFNPNIKADVLIYADGVEQLRGFLRLNSIKVDDQTHIIYEVTCHGQSADLFTTISERKLNQLDFTEYNHTLSSGNVIDSWATTIYKNGSPQAFAYGEGYMYAMLDKGNVKNISLWETNQFSPSLYAKTIVDKIFTNAGYTYTDDSYFNNANFKRLIVPAPSSLTADAATLESRRFKASRITTDQSLDLGSTLIFQNDSTGGNYDNGNNYNNTTGRYTLAAGGNYVFDVNLSIAYLSTGYLPPFTEDIWLVFGMYVNGVLKNTSTVTIDPLSPIFTIALYFKSLTLLSGDIVDIRLAQVYDDANQTNLTNSQFSLFIGTTSYLENDQTAYTFGYGETVDFGIFLNSELKQSDLLMSFVKMFNLYIEPNKDNPKMLRFVPRDQFYDGNQVDWTAKLDYSQPVEIVPMGELEANPYVFKYKDGKDDQNNFYQERYQTSYGSRTYKVDNQFIKNEKKIEIAFAPTQVKSYNSQKNFVLSYLPNNQDGDLRLLYYGGLATGVNWYLYAQYAGVGLNRSNQYAIPLTLHYDSISNPTFDINFGMPREIGVGAGYKITNANLVNNFYYKFLSEITGKNSKIVRAYFKITPKDWFNLSFADAYFFEGQYWRLNKIEDYNPIEDGVYMCEFLLAQFIEPVAIVNKTIGAGTAGQTDATTDYYPGGDTVFNPGIKGVNVGTSEGGGGIFQGDGIVQNGTLNGTFGLLSTDTIFQAGSNNSGAILCENFTVTKEDTLYIGNYEMYPSFLSGGAVRTVSANYTATKDDYLILADTTAGGITITLPAPVIGKTFITKKLTAAHSVIIDTATTSKIDGGDTHTSNQQWSAHQFTSDGVDYFITSNQP